MHVTVAPCRRGDDTNLHESIAIVGVLQEACETAELEAVSFWVHVPHYANNPPCPKATLALLRRIEELLDRQVPMADLPEEAAQWEERQRAAAEQDAELAKYVRELEERAGEHLTTVDTATTGATATTASQGPEPAVAVGRGGPTGVPRRGPSAPGRRSGSASAEWSVNGRSVASGALVGS